MKSLKNFLVKSSMKMLGSTALILSSLVVCSTSIMSGYQPKCPDELLK
ncbi:cyclic lactone autoinducer peptide [Clostridium sp. cel8]|jgi:cyclic lactone autoinducer peptide|nr:cyclic lactone autoinducer peptide [Clostridium sp. cel8]MBA5850381.1 cyclic lactone autoinducer peptide [Clostridium sp. cel8]